MNQIRIMRTQNGLTQSALAERLGVSQQAVARWETSKALPRVKTIMNLANLFGCTIDELYDRALPDRDSARGKEVTP